MSDKGQFFTIDKSLQNKVYEFILNKPKNILEPSVGKGHLVRNIKNVKWDLYELDNTLKPIIDDKINYGDFLKVDIIKKYKTIIGNPPYVKQKNKENLYIQFIRKCFNLLEVGGELIFIIPSDFFKLSSSSTLLTSMLKNGSITHIYHPNNENLFNGASIDIIIFRYQLGLKQNYCLYNNVVKNYVLTEGIFTFINGTKCINDFFDVYVGLVSGKESVYCCDIGNVELICKENILKKYIFIDEFPCENEEINEYLLNNKNILNTRKMFKIKEDNWWKWGAIRNIDIMKQTGNVFMLRIYQEMRKLLL